MDSSRKRRSNPLEWFEPEGHLTTAVYAADHGSERRKADGTRH
jgi:hypothetical protein